VLEQTDALPDWPKEISLSVETLKLRLEESKSQFAVHSSVPDWLDEFGRNELGEKWEALINAQQEEAGVFIRVNLSRYRVDKLQQLLQVQGIETQMLEGYPAALQVMKRARLHTLDLFRQGAFEFQDPGSQAIVPYLDTKVGMTVVDACAGAGGKSLHLADIMQNRGRIISTDVEASKLAELTKRAEKSRFSIIETYTLSRDSKENLPKYNADRVLIDAPCSGTGVLKRNPDTLWRLSPERLQNLIETQASLLQRYASAVMPGGVLVYATCSILPSENEYQVQAFLKNNPSFKLDKEQFLSPAVTGFDGFYMARMIKME
jgi:16S rRNA (cytosine967-C5)-methyltransferase